ncbi:MAG: ABC transporter permease, partial [Chthoniobacterales bacterium]
AAANLPRAWMRNSLTIAALAAAIAMTVGVSVMVFSFRKTVGMWVDQTLIADLFIAPASNEITGPSSFIPPEALQFLSTHEAIAAVNTFREIDLLIDGEETAVAVVDGAGERRTQFIRGDRDGIMRRFQNEQAVIVSEGFARRRHVRDGDSLEVATPDGVQRFVIAGTFYDYTRDSGIVYMSQSNFVHLWHDDRVNSAAVYLKNKSAAEKLSADFRANFSRAGQFVIFSNSSLRQRVFEIFDQTFAVTYVLRTIAIVVAVLGIFLGLTSLILERSREFAVVRAIGGSAAQVRRLLLWESGMVGFLAGGVGTAAGICLSTVLTGVINRAFFGWTIHLAFPWWPIVVLPVWIIVVAIAAAYFPAARAGRMQLAETLRSE